MFKIIYWLLDQNDDKKEIIKTEIMEGNHKLEIASKAGKQFKKDYPELKHNFFMDIEPI